MHVCPLAQGGILRLPHSVGVGLGVAVVGLGHLVVLGFPPHFEAQAMAALFWQLHFYAVVSKEEGFKPWW